jgi:exodeoxyribonuclease-3
MTLTLMTYNIRRGGGDRLDAVLRVIAARRPDILALQELGYAYRDRGRLLARVEAATGMRGHVAPSLFGQAVAVLVRPPGAFMSTGHVHRPMHHAAARVTVPTSAGPLTVVSTHLQATSPRRRRREARRVVTRARPIWPRGLRRAGPDRSPLTVVMGDLNALDPSTDHTGRLAMVPPRYRKRHLTGGRVDTRAVATLEAAGLVDLYRVVGNGPPETVPTGLGGTEFPVARLDYIMGTAPVAALARDCHVVRDGAASTASDHYPVVAEIDLNFSADRASEKPAPERR